MQSIVPNLWYAKDAEGVARYYVSLLPNSKIDSVTTMPGETPSGPEGAVVVVELTLLGMPFLIMSAGPLDPFNHAVSFAINCDTQAEIDQVYDRIVADGGRVEDCGWVADRYGLMWQVVPRRLNEMMKSPDRAAARRVTEAMLKMKKLDLAALEKALKG